MDITIFYPTKAKEKVQLDKLRKDKEVLRPETRFIRIAVNNQSSWKVQALRLLRHTKKQKLSRVLKEIMQVFHSSYFYYDSNFYNFQLLLNRSNRDPALEIYSRNDKPV